MRGLFNSHAALIGQEAWEIINAYRDELVENGDEEALAMVARIDRWKDKVRTEARRERAMGGLQ